MRDDLREALDRLVDETRTRPRTDHDPVGLVRRYEDPHDVEVAGLVSALLAFGNVRAIRASVAKVLDVLGPSPAKGLEELAPASLRRRLAGFRHRVYRGTDVAVLLVNVAHVRRVHGSLARFHDELVRAHGPEEGLARFADALRGERPSRGLAHLVPDPRKGSAVKRLHLYLRWMVRGDDGVDFGLFPRPASELIVPVDTHILRIARNLGLTRRVDASQKTAREITDALRTLRPADPVAYDFALCHHGVSGACPSRRVDAICSRCSLREVCLAYAGGPQSRRKGATKASSARRASRPTKAGPRST